MSTEPRTDEHAAARRSADRAFPSASPDADLMRPDARQRITLRARIVRALWKLADQLRAAADLVDNAAVDVHTAFRGAR